MIFRFFVDSTDEHQNYSSAVTDAICLASFTIRNSGEVRDPNSPSKTTSVITVNDGRIERHTNENGRLDICDSTTLDEPP